jgi:hypothetical protein
VSPAELTLAQGDAGLVVEVKVNDLAGRTRGSFMWNASGAAMRLPRDSMDALQMM